MNTVPTTLDRTSKSPSADHPAWCRYRHAGLAMHRGTTTVIRDRGDVRIDAYLIDYGNGPLISLDMAPDTPMSLIELSVVESVRLHACLTGLITSTENQTTVNPHDTRVSPSAPQCAIDALSLFPGITVAWARDLLDLYIRRDDLTPADRLAVLAHIRAHRASRND